MSIERKDLRILLVQSRPEQHIADHEFGAMVKYLGLQPEQVTTFNIEHGDIPADMAKDFHGVIIGGSGAYNVSRGEPTAHLPALLEFIKKTRELQIPLLGVCYGAQAIGHVYGTLVYKPETKEVGSKQMYLTPEGEKDPICTGIPQKFTANVGRTDDVEAVNDGVILAHSDITPIHLYKLNGVPIYGALFHPELNQKELRERLSFYVVSSYGKRYLEDDGSKEMDGAQAADEATLVLRNFVDKVVLPRWKD